MRKSLVHVFLLGSALALVGSSSSPALAQKKPAKSQAAPKKQPAAAAPAVDMDADAAPKGGGKKGGKPAAPVADAGPVRAGKPTEAAAQANRLYDAHKYTEAAPALYRVYSGETGDDEGNKQLAQFNLARALYQMKFYQAAYGIFSEIVDKPNHVKFNETLLWLAKLATDLPEPADIVERVGKYDDGQIKRFDNPQQRELYWELNYLLGRYKYRNGQIPESITLFEKVGADSKYYANALVSAGIAYVQQRASKPAVEAFEKVLDAAENGNLKGIEDSQHVRDLATINIADVFYSASIKLDEETNSPTVDQTRLSAAVKYWNKVDTGSDMWLDALFQESWAYFMAGDYSHALGNIHTIESPYFPDSFYPEADVLKALMYFQNCQYDDAMIIVAQLRSRYEPIRDELTKVLDNFKKSEKPEETFYKFLKDVREDRADKAKVSSKTLPVIKTALSDRALLRHLEYVKFLDREEARLKKSPAAFSSSKAGELVKDSVHDARELAVRTAGELGRKRYERNLEDLNEHLRNAQKILIDITAATRNQLDQAIAGSQINAEESKANIVKPDAEHVIWPFNGEYWRDELGFYRQTITSKCGR